MKNYFAMAFDLNQTALSRIGAVTALSPDESFISKSVIVVCDQGTSTESRSTGRITQMPAGQRRGDELQVEFLIFLYMYSLAVDVT